MIKKVTATNYLGESIVFDFTAPTKTGIALHHMEGLGPGKADINLSKNSNADGGEYNSARLNERNIVLYLAFLFNPDVETMRHLSYKYFPIKKKVKLRIETDHRTSEIEGYVETNEPVVFSIQQTTQISIICPDPYFYSYDKQVTTFSGIEGGFEFPFSNESLTEPLLEFGKIFMDRNKSVYYRGDAEVGIEIVMHSLGDVSGFSIFNLSTGEYMEIDSAKLASKTGSDIIAGDDIIISTVKGNKYVILFRNGVYTNILNCLKKGSTWFTLTKGDNRFMYKATLGETFIQVKISNNILYEGV